MRVVLDSNVIIAAFAARGLCNALFEHCLEQHTVILCEEILIEVEEKLLKKIKLAKSAVKDIINFLREFAQLKISQEVNPDICRDKNDLFILGVSLSAKADYIITGDKDLLIIETFQEIKITSPRSFWDAMKGNGKNKI